MTTVKNRITLQVYRLYFFDYFLTSLYLAYCLPCLIPRVGL